MNQITQLLESLSSDTEGQNLTNEVLEDLITLSWKPLRVRIYQRKEILYELLDTQVNKNEKNLVKESLNPYVQKQFLQEHLKDHEIINVISSIDKQHPFLPPYLAGILNKIEKNTCTAEELVVYMEYQLNNESMDKIEMHTYAKIAVEKWEEMCDYLYKQSDLHIPQEDTWHLTKLYLSRAYEILWATSLHAQIENKYKMVAHYLQMSYSCLLQSGYLQWERLESLLIDAANVYKVGGYLEEANILFESVISQLNTRINALTARIIDEKTPEIDVSESEEFLTLIELKFNYILDWMKNELELAYKYTEENNNIDAYEIYADVKATLFYLYEEGKTHNYIIKNQETTNYLDTARRFVYWWYLRETQEYDSAKKEFSLIRKGVDKNIDESIETLIKMWSLTFVDTHYQKKARFVSHENKESKVIPLIKK